MCDCWIGILNDYDQSNEHHFYLSDVEEKLNHRAAHSVFVVGLSYHLKAYKPTDYIDRRRGLSTLFNFCPLCGSKINWKGIRGGFRE
jgi:rRNA maturation endonuclease Nob1